VTEDEVLMDEFTSRPKPDDQSVEEQAEEFGHPAG
jgi:hypothetical protein